MNEVRAALSRFREATADTNEFAEAVSVFLKKTTGSQRASHANQDIVHTKRRDQSCVATYGF